MQTFIDTLGEMLAGNVWPLSFVVILLIVLHQLREEVRPIFQGVMIGLKVQSTNNASLWALGMLIGTLGSLQALAEVATQMHWVYVAALAKVLQPGLAAVLGFIMKGPANGKPTPPPTGTTPPIPPSP